MKGGGPRRLLLGLLLWVLCPALGLAAEFGGIGVQVVPTVVGELVVLRVLDESPAQVASLQPGDLIVEVDGFPLAGSNFAEVVPKRLWGPPGTSVTLKYKRPGEAGLQLVNVRRIPMQPDTVQTPAVRMLTPDQRKPKR